MITALPRARSEDTAYRSPQAVYLTLRLVSRRKVSTAATIPGQKKGELRIVSMRGKIWSDQSSLRLLPRSTEYSTIFSFPTRILLYHSGASQHARWRARHISIQQDPCQIYPRISHDASRHPLPTAMPLAPERRRRVEVTVSPGEEHFQAHGDSCQPQGSEILPSPW